jgi:hypothetical protein
MVLRKLQGHFSLLGSPVIVILSEMSCDATVLFDR